MDKDNFEKRFDLLEDDIIEIKNTLKQKRGLSILSFFLGFPKIIFFILMFIMQIAILFMIFQIYDKGVSRFF